MARLNFLGLLRLAALQLRRDARAGELRVLFFALLGPVLVKIAIDKTGEMTIKDSDLK